MWSFRAWQRKRILARNPVDVDLWQRVLDSLPILDGLGDDELAPDALGGDLLISIQADNAAALESVAEALAVSKSHIYRLQKSGIRRVRGMLSRFMQHW